jgi:WD40 repeat protein
MYFKKMFYLKQACVFTISLVISLYAPLSGSSLDGTSGIIVKNQNHVFHNGDSAQGFVRLGGGFTVRASSTGTLDIVTSVSGPIDLRDSGKLQLLKDIELDSSVTLSSGGFILGRGRALVLNGPLTIPAAKTLVISSDTVIEGKGNSLTFGRDSNFLIDTNATLTLRNLKVITSDRPASTPWVGLGGFHARLCLDNVEVMLFNDTSFFGGELYIHNDVKITGTSGFIYNSFSPCFVAQKSRLYFDIGTTFSFAPPTTDNTLFVLQDRTSTLHLNGCSFKTTATGMRITKGNLIFENKVILDTNTSLSISGLSLVANATEGTGLYSSKWSPNGRYIASAGTGFSLNVHEFINTNSLRLIASGGTGSSSTQPGGEVSWNPSGNSVAVIFQSPGGGTRQLEVFSFTGTALTKITERDYGTFPFTVDWHPNGVTLAIGGFGPAAANSGFATTTETRIYNFDGSNLLPVTGQGAGASSLIKTVAWSPNGNYLAIGGQDLKSGGGFLNNDQLRIYSFNGSTLTTVTSQPYGPPGLVGGGEIAALAWSPDGTRLALTGVTAAAVGGFASAFDTRVYGFDGTNLTALAGDNIFVGGDYTGRGIAWDPSGTFLIVGGGTGTGFKGLYLFTGSSLIRVAYPNPDTRIFDADWRPDGKFIVQAENTGGSGGNNLLVYKLNFLSWPTAQQTASNGLIFGNGSLGASSNLHVEVLGSAHVTIKGVVSDDSV